MFRGEFFVKGSDTSFLEGIDKEIRDILAGYVKAESITCTHGEKDAEAYFLSCFQAQPYWQEHPELLGSYAVKDDLFERAVGYAMVCGTGPDTVVMIHHYDVVTTEDYKRFAPLAFSPAELEAELMKIRSGFPGEIREDLESGEWLFGHGVCDMKGGGAVQMALLSRYGESVRKDPASLPGNLIVLAVPDEENLSAGMRAAVLLLEELREKLGLRYRMMINSEPHQRRDPRIGVFSAGSVGKMLPFFYVRGFLAHVGKMFEGLNPLGLLGAIIRKTEGNTDLCDIVGTEASPPPTWLYSRDRKIRYDVSMPLSAAGCLSVLSLNKTPAELMEMLGSLCREAFDEVLDDLGRQYASYRKATGRPACSLPWRTRADDFSQLYREAEEGYGEEFRRSFRQELQRLKQEYENGVMDLTECNFALVEHVFNYIDDLSPRVIYGLIPPYYPNVSNRYRTGSPEKILEIGSALEEYARSAFGQAYVTEEFYTGISDLSYSAVPDSEEIERTLKDTMPLYGSLYALPLKIVEKISMPCLNIGPWGKDFHKLTERVLKQDLLERTPRILHFAVEYILGVR
ncbi:MAG: M20/M25/M40 family metallo-hydrolase [Lachnospiraceae bacterium]|nr:M20/M25/M40 family metallo-hydrolase [Lachnospiraceae bacterium]